MAKNPALSARDHARALAKALEKVKARRAAVIAAHTTINHLPLVKAHKPKGFGIGIHIPKETGQHIRIPTPPKPIKATVKIKVPGKVVRGTLNGHPFTKFTKARYKVFNVNTRKR